MNKRIFIGLLLFFIGVFCYGAYRLYGIYDTYKQADIAYEEIADLVVQTKPTRPSESESPQAESTVPASEEVLTTIPEEPAEVREILYDIPVPITVDFQKLQQVNEDIIGWIYCEGTSINYPVLQGETNDTYLRHQYDGKYNYAGSIFMDYRCDPALEDPYSLIYGHNMSSDTMFHVLDHYRKQDYLQKHPRMFYLTPSGQNYSLEVICSNVTAYKDELRLFELLDDTRNLDLIRQKALADSGVEVSETDRLVLLATCANDYKEARCTLLCKVLPLKDT